MTRMALACVGADDLPGAVQSLVAERAEGLPFLIEEVLAGLIGEGALAERDGSWHATALAGTGVPGTFADSVRRRLDGLDADSRRVICAAAMLGRASMGAAGPGHEPGRRWRGGGAAAGSRPAARRGRP